MDFSPDVNAVCNYGRSPGSHMTPMSQMPKSSVNETWDGERGRATRPMETQRAIRKMQGILPFSEV